MIFFGILLIICVWAFTAADSNYWASLILGILLMADGLKTIITGDGGSYGTILGGGAPAYAETAWITFPIGTLFTVVSIRALWRGKGRPPKYTDEDVARAKETLDRMYLKEHGRLPEEDKKDT